MATLQSMDGQIMCIVEYFYPLDYRYFVQKHLYRLISQLIAQVHLHNVPRIYIFLFITLDSEGERGITNSPEYLPGTFFFRFPYFNSVKISAFRLKFFKRCSLHISFIRLVAFIIRSMNIAEKVDLALVFFRSELFQLNLLCSKTFTFTKHSEAYFCNPVHLATISSWIPQYQWLIQWMCFLCLLSVVNQPYFYC